MFFSGKVVTRVFRFTLRKIIINRSHRISSLVLSKPLYDQEAKVSSVCKKILKIEKPHSVVFTQVRAMGALSLMDPSSFSTPELAVVKHTSLSLNVDFEKKVLSGVATLNIEVIDNITEVILDSSKLNIESVETDEGKSLKFHIGEEVPNYGSKLTITLNQGLLSGAKWFKAKCQKCLHLPVGKDDINLTYTGYMYKPDIFKFLKKDLDEEHNNACEHHCVYFNNVDKLQFPPSEDWKISECSIDSDQEEFLVAAQNNFGEMNVAQRGEIYVLGPHGSHHRVTTPEEMKRVPLNCKKEMGIPAMTMDPVDDKTQIEQIKQVPSLYTRIVMNDDQKVLPKHRLADACPKRIKKLTIKIKYSTSPEASALQWLDPNQTSGKTLPFMFSQCQPIHARSILPCQDTPAVKFTYDAEVTAPPEFTVLMSALRGDVKGNTTSFRQPMPLPSYLVAIAVGQLDSKYLGPRSRVWSEKDVLDKSAWEFGDTERYLQAAEKLCGKYQWTEYDLLVLPPSFPYGGMENPCLTFVTPTLLAGDKSLADVIVHEIMHSWTGNLVTNRNFEHFWLNEGFTVYLERKVTASLEQDPVEAKKIRDFHSILGLQELTETVVDELGVDNQLTSLVVDLNGTHPDDAFSTVPYEKGSLFLRYLEDLLGGPGVFDEFLRSYLNNYSRKSLDTTDFKAYLYKHFKGDIRLDSVDWDTWFHKPGMPVVIPNYDTSITKAVDGLVERINGNFTFSIQDVQDFSPQQMIYFLQKLVDGQPIPIHALKDMEMQYKLKEIKNAEIRFRLLRMSIKSQDQSRLDDVFEFVNTQGRMKYVRPVYRDLYAWDYARELAIANFLKNEKYMMHVSAYTLRKDLHLND